MMERVPRAPTLFEIEASPVGADNDVITVAEDSVEGFGERRKPGRIARNDSCDGVTSSTERPTLQRTRPNLERATRFSEETSNGESPGPSPADRQPSSLSQSPSRRKLIRSQSQNVSFNSRASAKAIFAKNSLNYDPHSWYATFRAVCRTLLHDSFLLFPWIMLTVYALVIAIMAEVFGWEQTLETVPDVSIGIGGTMALLLTFRLNVCYNRWWEGRQLWGVAVTSSRSILMRLLAEGGDYFVDCQTNGRTDPHAPSPRTAAGYCLIFAFSLRKHMMGGRFKTADATTGLARLLTKGQLANVAHAAHPPLHALRSLRLCLNKLIAIAHQRSLRESTKATIGLESSLNKHADDLVMMLAGCERLCNTPCPAGYVGVLRLVMIAFLMMMPNILLFLKWYMIPVTSVTAFAILAVEEVAMHIEQPFGTDEDDLPLDAYCLTIEADLLALIDTDVDSSLADKPLS